MKKCMGPDMEKNNVGDHAMQLTDMDLHCIARILQSEYAEEAAQCLYCKYAFQCRERFKETKKPPYLDMYEKLKQITGVKIRLVHPETMQRDILAGSWMERHLDLYGKFTSISFEEQLGILHDPDILRYAGSYSVQMRQGDPRL